MTRLLAAFVALIIGSTAARAQDAAEAGFDAAINEALAPVSNVIVSTIFYTVPMFGADMPLIVLWLVIAAAIATIYFNFISFRAFKHAMELIRGDYSNPKDAGEVSHFQALATALSGTVGLGNIAGVVGRLQSLRMHAPHEGRLIADFARPMARAGTVRGASVPGHPD